MEGLCCRVAAVSESHPTPQPQLRSGVMTREGQNIANIRLYTVEPPNNERYGTANYVEVITKYYASH